MSTAAYRRRRYIQHTETTHRRNHRDHIKDAHRWARETAGQDWVLVKTPPDAGLGHVYVWAGPPETGARMICWGTEHSQLFLAHLRESLAAYRAAFAHAVSTDPEIIENNTPTSWDWSI